MSAFPDPALRWLARMTIGLLACLSTSFTAHAQTATSDALAFDQAYQAELRAENTALRARIARLAPAVQDLNRQVSEAVRADDWPAAQRLGAEMARLDPANADIRHFQGKLYARQRQYAQAIDLFDQAIARDAGNRWFYVSKAGAQAEAGDLAGALRTAQELERRHADWSIGHNLRAALLDGLGREREALAAYERAVSAPPASAQIRVNQGLLQRRLGHLAEARNAFAEALRIEPGYARAQDELASLPAP